MADVPTRNILLIKNFTVWTRHVTYTVSAFSSLTYYIGKQKVLLEQFHFCKCNFVKQIAESNCLATIITSSTIAVYIIKIRPRHILTNTQLQVRLCAGIDRFHMICGRLMFLEYLSRKKYCRTYVSPLKIMTKHGI